MKQVFLFFISIFITFHALAQQIHINHSKIDTCLDVKYMIPTNDGGIFFVGSTKCTSNTNGYIPTGISDTSINVMIGKMDNNENIQWVKVYGGTAVDSAVSACKTSDGGYAILAYTNSTDGDITGAKGNGDMWLIKVDSAGNKEWSKILGSTQYDNATSIAATPDSGYIILGITTGNYEDYGDADTNYGNTDWLVVKMDAAGHKQWSKVFGTTGYESFKGSILSANNGYYLASASATASLLFVDTSGNLIWNHSYVAQYNNVREMYSAIWDDRDSSIVIIGNENYAGSGYSCIWIEKVNKDGGVIWNRSVWEDYSAEHGYSIAKSVNGGYIGVGFVSVHYSMLGDPPAYTVNYDYGVIFVLDSMGYNMATKHFGCMNGFAYPKTIAPFNNGYVMAGRGTPTCSSFGPGSSSGFGNNFFAFMGIVPLSVINGIPNQRKIYPNPMNNVLHIDNDIRSTDYTLLNIVGQPVQKGTFTQQNNTLLLEALPAGLYLLQLTDDTGQREVLRVVKE